MKKICFILIVFISYGYAAIGQQDSTKKMENQIRKYWFVLLTNGSNVSQDAYPAAKIQRGHLDNIGRLYNEGKIKVAGPFGEKGDSILNSGLGIFIFDCPTREEVVTLLKTDPAISAGRLAYHIREWYTAPIGSFVPGKPAVKF